MTCYSSFENTISSNTKQGAIEAEQERQNNSYLFSSYLSSINEKKNVLLNKIDTIIGAYDSERNKIKYKLTLNHGDFSKKKYSKTQRVIIYFKKVSG